MKKPQNMFKNSITVVLCFLTLIACSERKEESKKELSEPAATSTYRDTVKEVESDSNIDSNKVTTTITKEDSLTQIILDRFKKYNETRSPIYLEQVIDIYDQTDGGVSEALSYSITEYVLKNNFLCDYLSCFSKIRDKKKMISFVAIIRYSQVYFPEYCANKTKFECYKEYAATLDEICTEY